MPRPRTRNVAAQQELARRSEVRRRFPLSTHSLSQADCRPTGIGRQDRARSGSLVSSDSLNSDCEWPRARRRQPKGTSFGHRRHHSSQHASPKSCTKENSTNCKRAKRITKTGRILNHRWQNRRHCPEHHHKNPNHNQSEPKQHHTTQLKQQTKNKPNVICLIVRLQGAASSCVVVVMSSTYLSRDQQQYGRKKFASRTNAKPRRLVILLRPFRSGALVQRRRLKATAPPVLDVDP